MPTAPVKSTKIRVSNNQNSALEKKLTSLLVAGALPGETAGLTASDRTAAAAIAAEAIATRKPDTPHIVTETGSRQNGDRVMRIAVANDDMPFLVDSVAATVVAHGVAIDRILHPILDVDRNGSALTGFTKQGAGQRESLIYLETDRLDARDRKALVSDIGETLDHVRAAVRDWRAMQARMAGDAAAITDAEQSAFLRWLNENRFTQLGFGEYTVSGGFSGALGVARLIGDDMLTVGSRKRAAAWLKKHGGVLTIKSNIASRVHRRAPLDLIVTMTPEGKLAIHAGLWTSAALAAQPQQVPLLRQRLDRMEKLLGFATSSHAAKALEHTFSVLPHDLLIGIDPDALEEVTLTAMSIADRPRPRLVLANDALDRHLFAFVWLPRDELTTGRRMAIADMIAASADAHLLNWSIDLGDGGVALLRYTFDRRDAQRRPDAKALDQAINDMVRGWLPSVEASLATRGDAGRAARLAMRYADAFPTNYRLGAGPEEAARDIERLHGLADASARSVRLYRNPDDNEHRLRLKLYSLSAVTLSDTVPALENFGFSVVEELSTELANDLGNLHRFVLEIAGSADEALGRQAVVEAAIADVLAGNAENDRFNALVVDAAMQPRDVTLFRALFRYLRQTGRAYGLDTVSSTLQRHAGVARSIIALFDARHNPAQRKGNGDAQAAVNRAIDRALANVAAIDEDRILRLLRSVVQATLRTNFFAPAASEALAFKLDSALVPGLPAPVPWREIFVYSPRVEGIHLRAGPVARGGLRWSDRRDDFRTEILGLMKAQRVKNAVIVPTGAKGGFYPKLLPDPAVNRDAWLAEGTESYRIFIRSLLSVTDNLVDGKVVHPTGVVIHDDDDPYFVVAADKGTATFSDVANAIALERGFWLGDAFASGGSVGYDHKAMGITAKGAWVSVQRHFAEMGIDVQTETIRVVGCGDMSGDVFGNGMLLSKAIKLVAAFDHRHIFIDPDPDPAASWDERARLFALPRSSWADYDTSLISRGGGVFSRSAKSIRLSAQARQALGIDEATIEPNALISAILKSPADLIWFGGIGTYVKAASEANGQVGDAANDAVRVDAEDLRARAIGEGANLGVTQAARIAFSLRGGRINTDFIDNSAGVDCSDHEVNIKIALNGEVAEGLLSMPKRNTLLAQMTDNVGALVLEDNRLQTLALSIAEGGGADAIPSLIRLIETFEESGRLDRKVEGLPANDVLARRAQDGHGLTRPELAILLSTAKLAMQEAIEAAPFATDDALLPELLHYFPTAMQRGQHAQAIAKHRLRGEIVATSIANQIINRLGIIHPFELAEEEGASLGDIAAAFVIADRLYGLGKLWDSIDAAETSESARLMLFEQVAVETRAQMADLLRNAIAGRSIGDAIAALKPAVDQISRNTFKLLRDEVRAQVRDFSRRLSAAGAPRKLVDQVVHLAELDGVVGVASLSGQTGIDPHVLTNAFTQLGAALGLDWAQGAAMRLSPTDPWERLLVAGLARDFQQMRLNFLVQHATNNPVETVEAWLAAHAVRVAQFRSLIDRARTIAVPSPAMLAQIAGQARVLLGRA